MAQSGRLARLGGLLYNRLTIAAASVESGGSKFSGAYGRRALSGPAPGGPQEAAKGAAAGAAAGGAAGAQAAQAAGETAAKRGGLNVFQWAILGGLGLGGAYTYTLFTSKLPQQPALGSSPSGPSAAAAAASKPGDYGSVRKAIAGLLDTEGYDDGSYGPLLVRLAWHASGTYCKATGTGGSHGATMRFAPECEWGANKGLHIARSLLEPLKAQFPWISNADLWTLAGVVAIEEMGGPVVPWRPGRSDHPDGSKIVPDGRLPDAAQGAQHIRDIFYRMGFDDRDIVALSGAHTLGRCHIDRSGFLGPWTNAPTTFSNLYFQELLNNKWTKKKWDGPLQYEDKTKTLMMLPTDMSLIWDKKFKKYVDQYAKDEEAFFKDFASAFSRLLELGVPFPAETAKAA